MANIEKRRLKNGQLRFRVKIRVKGQPDQSATFDKLSNAKKWATQTEAAIHAGKYFKGASGRKYTLSTAIDRYLRDIMPTKPKSAKDQIKYLDYWKRALGDYLLADVSPALLANELDTLLKSRSGATVNAYLAPLSHLFNTAIKKWDWIEESPLKRVTRPKCNKSRVRFLSDTERKSLLKECEFSRNKDLYLIVILALSTGARYSELLGIKWKDVDFDRGVIMLHQTKNGSNRLLTLTGFAMVLMEERRAKRGRLNDGLIFHKDGKQLDIRPAFSCALKRAGIADFRFHDLRHTAASYLAMNGATLLEIAAVLGHKTLAMAHRYSHLSDEHTSKIVARMNHSIFDGN